MSDKVTIAALQQMKRDGKKIAGVVAWDTPMARIADLAGIDLVSVGDSVGANLWGHATPLEVTMDEMLIVSKAVRRGTSRALVSCDLPYGPAQAKAVKIPVIGGFGGGPWVDGRVRLAHTAIGYSDKWLDSKTETYVNTAKAALGAFTALIADVRAGKQIKG